MANRRAKQVAVQWVPSHCADAQVEAGKITAADKAGNDRADQLAGLLAGTKRAAPPMRKMAAECRESVSGWVGWIAQAASLAYDRGWSQAERTKKLPQEPACRPGARREHDLQC